MSEKQTTADAEREARERVHGLLGIGQLSCHESHGRMGAERCDRLTAAFLSDARELAKARARAEAAETALRRIVANPCLAVGGGECRPDCNHADHVARRALSAPTAVPTESGGGA